MGWKVLEWLSSRESEIVGLVLHPKDRQKYGEEIRQAADLPPEKVFDGTHLDDPRVLREIDRLAPDIGVSALFGYILKPDFLALFSQGTINLHPSYLPYNRGCFPNVWSIVDGTPAGVTIHYVDEGVDTGDIIAQRPVAVLPTDTGKSLYRKLERASLSLFEETWPEIEQGRANRQPQTKSEGSFHGSAHVEEIDHIDLDRTYRAGDLINILRARTFSPYNGAYFVVDGKRVYMRVSLETEKGN